MVRISASLAGQPAPRVHPRPWWRYTLFGYAVAALSVGLVVLAKENVLSQRALEGTPLLLAAIALTTWFGGVGPGLLATSLATLAADYYFIPPIYTWAVEPQEIPGLITFALSALLFVWISAARRSSEEALRSAHDEMEAAVVQRTADLAQANEELRAEIAERKRSERAQEELAGRLISAQEDERSRIGRELHDHVSQRLGILAIKIDQLRMSTSSASAISPALDELREQTSEITDDIHGLSHRLHSSMLDHLGVVPALQRLVEECAQRYAIPIGFTHTPLPAPVSSDVALCLFRIVEESLTNISKHSQAPAARVEMAAHDGGIRLTVADDGQGFDPAILETRAGLGFVSMRERLRLVRGTIHVQSAPSRGTRIDVWVPSKGGTG
jgi:signal transduction histidine kinase